MSEPSTALRVAANLREMADFIENDEHVLPEEMEIADKLRVLALDHRINYEQLPAACRATAEMLEGLDVLFKPLLEWIREGELADYCADGKLTDENKGKASER